MSIFEQPRRLVGLGMGRLDECVKRAFLTPPSSRDGYFLGRANLPRFGDSTRVSVPTDEINIDDDDDHDEMR